MRQFITFLIFFKFLYYYLFLYYFIALRYKSFYFLEESKNFSFEENKEKCATFFFPFYYLRQSYRLRRYFRNLRVALYIYSHYFIPTRKAYALAVSSCRWIGYVGYLLKSNFGGFERQSFALVESVVRVQSCACVRGPDGIQHKLAFLAREDATKDVLKNPVLDLPYTSGYSSSSSLSFSLLRRDFPEAAGSPEYHDCLSRPFSARSASKSRRYPREITITVDSRQNDTWLGIGLGRLVVFLAAFSPRPPPVRHSCRVNP